MINKPIFKVSIKNNSKLWLIHCIIGLSFLLLMRVILGLMMNTFGDYATSALGKGYSAIDTIAGMFSLTGNFSSLVLVFLLIAGGSFINKPASDGSLATYLTVPVSRKNYTITTQVAYLTMTTALIATLAIVGFGLAMTFGGIRVNATFVGNYFAVCGVFALVNLTMCGITYFVATLCSGTKVKALCNLPAVLFYILGIFASLGQAFEKLKFMRYLSPYSWFNLTYIMENNVSEEIRGSGTLLDLSTTYQWFDKNQWLPAIFCLIIIVATSVASVFIYRKKKYAI